MKPRITVLTLGVDDLDVAVSFYRDGLGLRTEGIVGTEFEHGAVAFFDLQPGLRLSQRGGVRALGARAGDGAAERRSLRMCGRRRSSAS